MEKPKGKAKAKRGELIPSLADFLRFDVPFAFVSTLPFDECVTRILGIEAQSTFSLRYTVEIQPAYYVDGDPISEFRVLIQGTGVEATGYLRAFSEERTCYVEGRIRANLLRYIGVGFLVGSGLLAAISLAYGVSMNWGAAGTCFWLGFPLVAILVWLVDFGQRENLLRMIRTRLEVRRMIDSLG